MDINKKRIIKNSAIILAMIAVIVIVTLYTTNENVQNLIDTYIFKKEVYEEKTTSIELINDNSNIYAYDKYIVTLSNGKLTSYGTSGNKEFTEDVSISNPIFDSSEKFLAIAENGGNKIYLISGSNIVWQNDLEGEISQINVNKNGYLSVAVKGTSYKTVIITYNDKGKELFKTYLSSTNAIKTAISNDNKYLALAEVNVSGSIIQSNIKIISLQKAEKDPTNSVVNTYKLDSGSLITNIKYQDRGKLICMLNDSIQIIENESIKKLIDIDNSLKYVDINLKNAVLSIGEKQKGLFTSNMQVLIKDTNILTESLYTLEGTINFVETNGSNIAINMGSDVHFINTSGWLQKKYKASKEITDIVLGDSIAGIVYHDKIDVIAL